MTYELAAQTNPPHMRNVIYARKSTESTDRQVQSIEDQLGAMRALAEREGIPVTEEFTEMKSAKAPGIRPVFGHIMKEIDKGKINGLFAWSISRLARNQADGGLLAYYLQIGKLQWIRTSDRPYFPEDSALLLAIEYGVATQDLQNLRKNVSRGMKGKVERGGHPGRAPIGYKNDRLAKTILPDPVTFPLMRRAWDMLLTGSTMSDIHRAMQSWNLRSSSRAVNTISRSHVHKIFRSPFYSGQLSYQGQTFPGVHLPMITPEEFHEAQVTLGNIARPKAETHTFPYTGFIRHDCGCLVTAERKVKHYPKTGNTATYTYYHCTGSTGCPKPSVSESYIESRILETLESVHMSEPVARWCEEAFAEVQPGRILGDEGAKVSAGMSRKQLEAKSESLLEMRLTNEISATEFMHAKEKLNARLETVKSGEEQLERLHARASYILRDRLRAATMLRENFRSGAPDFKRAYAKTLSNDYLLTLESGALNLKIKLDPILQLFTTFEPLRDGSEKPQAGHKLPSMSGWWPFVSELRTTVYQVALEKAKSGLQICTDNKSYLP